MVVLPGTLGQRVWAKHEAVGVGEVAVGWCEQQERMRVQRRMQRWAEKIWEQVEVRGRRGGWEGRERAQVGRWRACAQVERCVRVRLR